jgi:hypothetical protein
VLKYIGKERTVLSRLGFPGQVSSLHPRFSHLQFLPIAPQALNHHFIFPLRPVSHSPSLFCHLSLLKDISLPETVPTTASKIQELQNGSLGTL